MDVDERQAVIASQAGDRSAFGVLYDRYLDRIYRFVYYKVHNREVAEDITSTVFLKAFEKIGSFNVDKGAYSTWLYAIARNAVIDHYRSAKYHEDIDDIFDLGEDERTEEKIDAREMLKDVADYLGTLSPEQREIVTLRIWGEHSYKEIAEIVGGTEGSVKMAFSRAIRDVRDKFGPLGVIVLLALKDLSS